MLVTELEQRLKQDGLKAVYLVLGPESFLRAEALRLIKEAAARGAGGAREPACDLTELDAAEMDPKRLFDDLRTPSLFAPRRVIFIDNAANLFSDSFAILAGYVQAPAPRTVLVLVAEQLGKPKASRRKASKKKSDEPAPDPATLITKLVHVECPAIQQRELPSWCMARARLCGKQLDMAAARTLVELSGANLGQIDGQIQSLASYVKDRPRITSEDVTNLVGGDRVRTIWELVGATTEGNVALGIRALDRLLRDSENTPSRLIGAIAREVRRLTVLKELLDARVSAAEIESRTRMPRWLIDKLSRSLRATSADTLKRRLRLLLEADMACKTGGGQDQWIMERLVMQLCGV